MTREQRKLMKAFNKATAPKINEVPWHAFHRGETTKYNPRATGSLIVTAEDEPRNVILFNELDGGGGVVSREIADHIVQLHNRWLKSLERKR